MKKSYLFVYSNAFGKRSEVTEYIKNSKNIFTWRYDLPNSFYLVSEQSAEKLREYFLDFSDKGIFVITEFQDNYDGYLVDRSWSVINDKELLPKDE